MEMTTTDIQSNALNVKKLRGTAAEVYFNRDLESSEDAVNMVCIQLYYE